MPVPPKFQERIAGKVIAEADRQEKNAAMAALMVDLRYIESRDGSTIDLLGLQAAIAWHLVRCGWRPDPDRRMIKPRRVTAQGVAANAVEWVGVDEPDDPLANYRELTAQEIQKLPPMQRAQVLKRLGAGDSPDLPPNPGWHVKTNIAIMDAPDVDSDDFNWSGRQG